MNKIDITVVFMKLRHLGERWVNSEIGSGKTQQEKAMISEFALVFRRSPVVKIAEI